MVCFFFLYSFLLKLFWCQKRFLHLWHFTEFLYRKLIFLIHLFHNSLVLPGSNSFSVEGKFSKVAIFANIDLPQILHFQGFRLSAFESRIWVHFVSSCPCIKNTWFCCYCCCSYMCNSNIFTDPNSNYRTSLNNPW